MPTRRSVVTSALSALALAALRGGLAGPAAAGTGTGAVSGQGGDLWLNRLTFGATPDLRDDLARMGPLAWVEAQLALPAEDAGLTARLKAARLRITYPAGDDGNGGRWPALDEDRPLHWVQAGAAPDRAATLVDWAQPMDFAERVRPADEVVAAALIRAVHAPAQLREVMTQFWHDHFNIHARKDEFTAAFFPWHDAALRQMAFGNFRALLGQVARAPSMLAYLNNADSRASPANENFARELLELHTLGAGNYLNDRFARWHLVPQVQGVAVGYIDEDVYEVARALTGWTIGDGRWIAEGVEAPRTGLFHYAEAWHDPYQKRVLGVEFAPNRAALADGEEVLDILARHPGTAAHVCGKIARRFLADAPDPALVDRLAAVFLEGVEAPDQIARVIRALVADPAFAAPAQKLRRPFEMLAALLRASGAEVTGRENGFDWQLQRAGWHQHSYPPPTGHPDRAEAWTGSTTLLRLVDYALQAHEDWFGVTSTRLTDLPDAVRSLGDLAAYWQARVTGAGQGDDLAEVWALFGLTPADAVPTDAETRHQASAAALALAALRPEFLLR